MIDGVNIYTDPGPYAYSLGGMVPPPPDGKPLPESMCGNCRRDRHDHPLTEAVARMFDSTDFDEDYDPAKDDSPIVCPGSDCCGPPRPPAPYRNPYGIGSWSLSKAPWMMYPGEGVVAPQKFANVVAIADELLGSWGYHEHFAPSPTPLEKTQTIVEGILASIPSLNAYTWLPAVVDEGSHEYEQAALEAAPKAIEHKAPESPGYDFSGINAAPSYPSVLNGKKKKK